MLTEERQNIIRHMLLEQKKVSVSDLSKKFDVSFETIRRDLKALEKEGFAEKTYGGAVFRQRVRNTADFAALSNVMVDVKRQLAASAVRTVVVNDCIFIDFSTTCLQFAHLLPDINVTVMSNSLAVCNELSQHSAVTLYACGGAWDPKNCAFMGNQALDSLSSFYFDKAYLSCRALSMEKGISDKTEAESEIRRQVIRSAREVVLLVDHTKFDRSAFVRTADFDGISTIITDQPLSAAWQSFLEEQNVRLVIAGSSDGMPADDDDVSEDEAASPGLSESEFINS